MAEILPLIEGTSLRQSQTVISNNFSTLTNNSADSVPPANPVQGQFWFDSSVPALKIYSGGIWETVWS